MQFGMRSRAVVVSAAVTIVALYSAWHTGGHMWHYVVAEHTADARLTNRERGDEVAEAFAMPPDVFSFYANYIVPGDRVYYQVAPGALGEFIDQPTAFRYIAHFDFLPAVETTDLAKATVVLSYFEDPASLGVRFLTQVQAGQQPYYVSRIKAP